MTRCVVFLILVVGSGTIWGSPPNIVFMMADDMGMGDTSAYQDFTGNPDDVQVRTPNMERLARMGIRFTDAHTPASRCSPTRYGLLTGRYPWRNRLKFWVLFGAQGDPMIESDRPTIASMLRDNGYATAMVGKWHVGLRYRRSDGTPAAEFKDADLTKPLHTTPIDHGFDFARFTSRSHDTSGPDPTLKKPKKAKRNLPEQTVGPGHVHGRIAVGATENGRQLVDKGPDVYALRKLGSRHSNHALEWLQSHVEGNESGKPFFLYYPANSNHGPYTPDLSIDGVPVAGAARTVAGQSMDKRHDFVYENDVALGRLIDWLAQTPDPRSDDKTLIENTLVVFTSDNGAEKDSDVATGPFRSNKGSCYEGGHRVPFIACWPAGGVGDGDPTTAGLSSASPIGLQDMYATFSELVGAELPDLRKGEKGGEDSFSVLPALRGKTLANRSPMFVHDHKQSKDDPAVSALRVDNPKVGDETFDGQWKLFFDARLIRLGEAHPFELYNLAVDPRESENLIGLKSLEPLVNYLSALAELHRNSGGHRAATFASSDRWELDLTQYEFGSDGGASIGISGFVGKQRLFANWAIVGENSRFDYSSDGIGIASKDAKVAGRGEVDGGEAIAVTFNRDVIVESAAIFAGKSGTCGGYYRMGDKAPLAIYCVDADNDSKDQSGRLSDLGVLRAGESLTLDSSPHFGVENPGVW
ncbi:MAG: arylsulfatase, partial [Planctomycetota bacterium]